MTEVLIFSEDTHGKIFFMNLVNRMKQENYIDRNNAFNTDRYPGMCNPSIKGRIIAKREDLGYQKFIINLDADGKKIDEIIQDVVVHFPNGYEGDISVVFNRHEIEEWICCSENISFNEKPSKILKHERKYEKRHLPNYVQKLDIEKLLRDCESFCEFIDCLNSI